MIYDVVLKNNKDCLLCGDIEINLSNIEKPLNLLNFELDIETKGDISYLVIKNNKYDMILTKTDEEQPVFTVEILLLNDDRAVFKGVCLTFKQIQDDLYDIFYDDIEVDENKVNSTLLGIEMDMIHIRKEKQRLDEKFDMLMGQLKGMN